MKKSCPTETELWNCENAFEFICPLKWDCLDTTESDDIRYCQVCQQNVYLCQTPLEFVNQGNFGRCVAIPQEMTPKEIYREHGKSASKLMGRVAIRNQTNYSREQKWWQSVFDLNPTFNQNEMTEIRYKMEHTHYN